MPKKLKVILWSGGTMMNERGNGNSLLTTREVAGLLHVHPNTVRKWSNNGLLRAYRVGSRGDRRFEREEIKRFLERERVAS